MNGRGKSGCWAVKEEKVGTGDDDWDGYRVGVPHQSMEASMDKLAEH